MPFKHVHVVKCIKKERLTEDVLSYRSFQTPLRKGGTIHLYFCFFTPGSRVVLIWFEHMFIEQLTGIENRLPCLLTDECTWYIYIYTCTLFKNTCRFISSDYCKTCSPLFLETNHFESFFPLNWNIKGIWIEPLIR